METLLQHKTIITKKEILNKISVDLKKQFIGLDSVIDEVINLVNAWYLFPNAQLRPTVINLWGMTGSGKTALVKKLVELLDFKKYYTQLDMGEFESDSASWIKTILTDELEFFHEKPSIICMDEFQFARTIDKSGNELGKDKLRVIWDLLDSGRISYIPNINAFYIKRAESCLLNLLKAQEKGVVIENGIVKNGADVFFEIFKGYYFENQDRDGKPLKEDYFTSHDFLQGLFYLFDDDAITKEILEERIKKSHLEDIINLIIEGAKTRTGVKELDLSKSLIFVLGNLDEAYYMSNSLNPDISADELHEATSKITIANIKGALKKRFRNEQVARLGNNHIIYHSFTNQNFKELIKRELDRINNFVNEQFGFTFLYQPTLHEIIYNEGVFPSQGTRPVLTTIKNLVEAWIGKIMVEVIEKNMQITNIEWSYCDDKYIFVFKDNSNTILNIYEEKVNLKIDSLRKTTNKQVQAHTAVHESGHAILAALTLRILPSVVISKTAGDNCEGFCMVNFPEGILTKEVLKKDIIICLGGYVAEKIIFGEENTSSGVYSDIENASELANKAIKYYGMGSEAIHINVPSTNTNEYFFNKERYSDEAICLIKNCQAEAEEILSRNKLLLLKMAEYLTEHNKMEEQAICEIVKKYGVEKWLTNQDFVKKDNYFLFNDCIKKQIDELEKSNSLK
ncbi:MAG: hypothetical protein SFY56_13060 [Bacteroidota bacterium]|nr:hypothetical protein [Bacteroidota bacterium]